MKLSKTNKDLNKISNLINIRNYIVYQIENPKTNKKTSFDLIKVLNQIDLEINENLIDTFLNKNEDTKERKE